MIKQKIRLFRQTTFSECGLCCIAMISDYYGYRKPISFYRQLFRVGRDGIDISQMYLLFQQLHLEPHAYVVNEPKEFNFGEHPYVMLTKDNHYVVIQKKGKNFIVFDPSSGRHKYNMDNIANINGGVLLEAFPNEGFKKNKDQIEYYRHVKKFFSNVLPLYSLVLIFSLGTYIVSILVPILLERIINILVYNQSINLINFLTSIGIVFFLYFFFSHIQNVLTIKLQKKLNSNINLYTTKHLLNLPFSYFDNRGEENILYRLGLLPQLIDAISNSFVQATLNFLGVIALSLYVMYRFPYLSAMIILIILFLGILLLIFNLYILSQKQDEMKKEADAKETQTEIITTIFQIKSSRLTGYFYNQYVNLFEIYNLKNEKNKRKIYFFNLVISLYSMFIPILVIVYSISELNVNVGEIFFIYSIIGMILSNSTLFFTVLTNIIMIKPALHYLNDIYDEKEQTVNGNNKIKFFNNLEINNVSFKYNDVGNNLLSNVNLNVHKGQKVSIVGLSGSGKSSLIKLLSGLYRHYDGEITINNIPIEEIEEEFFSKEVAIVTQNAAVFNKTIKENITLGDKTISEKSIWDALKNVNLYDVVENLPMKLNTFINNRGGNFSGGQSQRLAIARAIVKNPSLIILDEATSSLDSVNEKIVYDNLKKEGISILSISHRLTTVKDSDVIYVMDCGKIVESGTHEELLINNQLYTKLYSSQ